MLSEYPSERFSFFVSLEAINLKYHFTGIDLWKKKKKNQEKKKKVRLPVTLCSEITSIYLLVQHQKQKERIPGQVTLHIERPSRKPRK